MRRTWPFACAVGGGLTVASCVVFGALVQLFPVFTDGTFWWMLRYSVPPGAIVGGLLGLSAHALSRMRRPWLAYFAIAVLGASATLVVALGADALLIADPPRPGPLGAWPVGLIGWVLFCWYLVPNGIVVGAWTFAAVRRAARHQKPS